MDIKIGARIIASDGEAGTVERIILHPETNELEGVVAVQGGILKRDVVIPADMLVDADEDGLHVRATTTGVGELEPFAQSQYTVPPEDWMPPSDQPSAFYLFPLSPMAVGMFAPPTQEALSDEEVMDLEAGEAALDSSTEVLCKDGSGGRLERVVTEEGSDRVTHLIIRHGALAGRLVAVSIQDVERMDDEAVRLALSCDELAKLPTYTE
jgi:hypothetical protein